MTVNARTKRSVSLRTRETTAFYLFMSPWLVGMVFLFAIPLVATFLLSFTDWNLFQPPEWVGLDNYTDLLFTPGSAFWLAFWNTAYYAVILVPLNLALSIGFAVLLNQPLVLRRFFRTAFYLPSTIPIVAVVMLWSWLLAPSGIVNSILGTVGIDGPAWLVDPAWVKNGLIIMGVWQMGGGVVLFLAGLQGISPMLYEAATLDGAGAWRRFWSITIPMLSPIILFNLIIGVIGSLQVFAQVYIVTQGHNPGAVMLVPLVYSNAFEFGKMGDASAISVLFVLLILAVTAVILRWSRRWVYYEGEVAQ
ncbi:sugar ABC transporter permease [Microbacterium ulmi]|uniref:Sugar ABC transporter permease n=1 Tax=Microbacterium ulmi TaxID=179095 RepID=A0A7Y2LY90_9MICO|nr:sugar ABC transporter permease [Microbacterium ulmi]